MSDNCYLPHNNNVLWEEIKAKFKECPNNIKDLNKIFFKDKSPFFTEIDKKYKNEGEEFIKIYKNLQNLVLYLESMPKEIPLLKTNTKGKKEFTRKEVALIFLLSFFNLIDIKQEKERQTNHFRVYKVLLSSNKTTFEFGRCFLNYLTIIGKWLSDNNPILDEKIKFIRDTLDENNFSKFKQETKLCEVTFNKKDSLFDSNSSYCVDFANRYIGGGVLEGGCVQEEILFATQPEAIVSMFFMEVMSNNDAIRIDNTIQYSKYSGYGHRFKFENSAIEINNNNNINYLDNIKKYKIIAIDAIVQKINFDRVIKKDYIKRDIYKSFIGFYLVNFEKEGKNEEKSIATGNWGCGVFNGDHELKFFQQWVAASFAGIRRLDYYCYGAQEMTEIVNNFNKIENYYKKANELYEDLINKKLINGNVFNSLFDENYKGIKNKENVDCVCIIN